VSANQIFRRIRRILEAEAREAYEKLTREERELQDFDEELRRATGTDAADAAGDTRPGARSGSAPGGGSGAKTRSGPSGTGAGGGARSTAHGGKSGARGGGRKPGERDDAYYLSVLGLGAAATDADIRAAHRKLMRRHHPDRVATLDAERQRAAAEAAKRINEAYQILARRRGFR
jgi:DnaJ-domain-containing protein 1